MCRSILELRGLEPAATGDEIRAAARQYVRKVSGIRHPNAATEAGFEDAIDRIAQITTDLLAELPARRQPPKRVPPNRLGHPT
ncbi:MAG: DUF2277 domain-containing protein [Ilumatobacter sp.]